MKFQPQLSARDGAIFQRRDAENAETRRAGTSQNYLSRWQNIFLSLRTSAFSAPPRFSELEPS